MVAIDGLSLGDALGDVLGRIDGDTEGLVLGELEGRCDGDHDGDALGANELHVPSTLAGALHSPLACKHTRSNAHSLSRQQPSFVTHGGQSPPQSTSVSVPPITPSPHTALDGDSEGDTLGDHDGDALGIALGDDDGRPVAAVGDALGLALGNTLGDDDGLTLGKALGDAEGDTVGDIDGDALGALVGT